MRIFLIGFMGSGKSSFGKMLAYKLGFTFVDLDQMIETKTAIKISDIFETDGEEKFRQIEHECLKEVILTDNVVISTGGGTPCFFNNMDLINDNGISVYIKLNPGILTSRLESDKGKRPVLKHAGNRKDLEKYITELLQIREPFYLRSKIIVEGKNINSKKIIELLTGYMDTTENGN